MTTYKPANRKRYNRSKACLAFVEALAIEAGYFVKGNDKSGIDEFLDDVEICRQVWARWIPTAFGRCDHTQRRY